MRLGHWRPELHCKDVHLYTVDSWLLFTPVFDPCIYEHLISSMETVRALLVYYQIAHDQFVILEHTPLSNLNAGVPPRLLVLPGRL